MSKWDDSWKWLHVRNGISAGVSTVSNTQRPPEHGLLKDSDHASMSLSYLCHRPSVTIIVRIKTIVWLTDELIND